MIVIENATSGAQRASVIFLRIFPNEVREFVSSSLLYSVRR